MRDPIERMVKFVWGQKQQAAAEHARAVWSRRIPILLPCVREVVDVFLGGLTEPAEPPPVALLADTGRELCPLVIAFQARPPEREGAEPETGASAVFRCEADGIVYGFRYPFHPLLRDLRPEQFADLGEPETVEAHRLGNAVADFLEWVSIGEGRGSRRLRFWSPPAAERATLRIVPA
jgi:hypothetical protein